MTPRIRYPCTYPLAAALLVATSTRVGAGEWTIAPHFSIGEIYSDNINLAAVDVQSDFVTRTTPGLSLRGKGRRASVNVDYNLQNLTYADQGDRNTINHQLQSNVNSELIRDVFFLDVNASMYQALVSSQGPITNRTFQLDTNRTNVTTWGVSPHVAHRFGTWADFRGGTSFSDVSTTADSGGGAGAGGGGGMHWHSSLSSGPRFTRTSWDLSYSQRSVNHSNGGQASTFQSFNASGSLVVNRYVRVHSSVGVEDNQFTGSRNQGGAPTWSIGGTLTPSRLTSVSGSYGHRSFGNTKSFDFQHHHRRVIIGGSYSEELRTSNDLLREQQLIPLVDEFGNPVFDPVGNDDFGVPTEDLTLTNDVFINRRLSVNIGYQRKRDNFSVRIFRSERESQSTQTAEGTPETETTTGTSASWRRSFSHRMSGGVRSLYQSTEGGLTSAGNLGGGGIGGGTGSGGFGGRGPTRGAGEFVSFSPFLSYVIGPHVSSQLSYSYTERITDDPNSEYSENSVQGSLSFAF